MKQSKERLLATIEKLKKQVEAMADEPTILSMEVTKTVKFEVAKEDIVGSHNYKTANNIIYGLGDGWRLPTIEELQAMYEAKIITEGCYWSSTEYYSFFAWYYSFINGYSDIYFKTSTYRVRAVRTVKG